MAKFPSQRKITYQTGALSNDAYTQLTSGGVGGHLNLPKDLSLLNRRGYASTTRKGVPLVYQCKIDFYLHDEDGQGPSSAMGADLQSVLKVDGCQNNWVMKNAAVKFHAARENMMRKAGISKGVRGAYDHEIRYEYDAGSDTWLVPIDGDGNAFTGGTWDVTTMRTEDDNDFTLKLVGSAVSEDSSISTAVQQIGYSYLASRQNLREDTNDESENIGLRSILGDMLSDGNVGLASRDDYSLDAEDNQDQVPYDHFAVSETDHDITEPVELGRAIAGFGNAYGSMIVDIPFGIANARATVYDAADTAVNPAGLMCVEVLDIYEMQG